MLLGIVMPLMWVAGGFLVYLILGVPFWGAALIGAIVRDGRAIFPHGEDMLMPGDRVIVFTDSSRALEVEKAL